MTDIHTSTDTSRAAERTAAEQGALPTPPVFGGYSQDKWRNRLAEVAAMAEAGNIAGLLEFPIYSRSTNARALDRYRNLCITALLAARIDA